MEALFSALDQSVNFVEDALTGFVEARYVRKTEDYFIAYLSSQTGCNRGCKFCHLTATRQTKFEDVDWEGFEAQADTIFDHYDADRPARYMHYNFMARGEPLLNPWLREDSASVLTMLGSKATDRNLFPKFNISTIMPKDAPRPHREQRLAEMFPIVTPTIYYSIYSVVDWWRDKWLPAAMPVDQALDELKEYQDLSKKLVKFHGAFIKGENDSDSDIQRMLDKIAKSGIQAEFNVVRYNPFSSDQGEESDELARISSQIGKVMPVKTIPRVGFDVSASCGMFVSAI